MRMPSSRSATPSFFFSTPALKPGSKSRLSLTWRPGSTRKGATNLSILSWRPDTSAALQLDADRVAGDDRAGLAAHERRDVGDRPDRRELARLLGEEGGRLHLGPHRARRELGVAELHRARPADRLLI